MAGIDDWPLTAPGSVRWLATLVAVFSGDWPSRLIKGTLPRIHIVELPTGINLHLCSQAMCQIYPWKVSLVGVAYVFLTKETAIYPWKSNWGRLCVYNLTSSKSISAFPLSLAIHVQRLQLWCFAPPALAASALVVVRVPPCCEVQPVGVCHHGFDVRERCPVQH